MTQRENAASGVEHCESEGSGIASDNERRDWFVRAFSDEYLRVYRHRGLEEAREEVARALEWLGLTHARSTILDLCCGAGRHLRPLEELGHNAVGFDLSADLLRRARQRHRGSRVVRGDMRALPFVESFDGICSFFTSFGYFFEHAQHLQVLRGIARALRPDGRFLLDLPDRRTVCETLVPQSHRSDGDLEIEERRWIKGARVEKEVTVTSSVGQERYHESVRLFHLEEMLQLCSEVGLRIEETHGSFDGEQPYAAGVTPRMILVGGRT